MSPVLEMLWQKLGSLKGDISQEINIPNRKGSFPDVSAIFFFGGGDRCNRFK